MGQTVAASGMTAAVSADARRGRAHMAVRPAASMLVAAGPAAEIGARALDGIQVPVA
jgi:hypothetical protein